MWKINLSDTSQIEVIRAGENAIEDVVFGVYDYNPVEKTHNSINYCYVSDCGVVRHNLGDIYDFKTMEKIIIRIKEMHKKSLEMV